MIRKAGQIWASGGCGAFSSTFNEAIDQVSMTRSGLTEGRMETEQTGAMQSTAQNEEILANYKQAVERAIARLPVRNGVVDIDAIWTETSIPYDLLRTLLQHEDLRLPENVERINLKSHVRKGERRGDSKRRRKR
jgi:hypothetical protein